MTVDKSTFLRVGLLLVGGTVATIALVFFLNKDQVRDGLQFETYFRESVQGLDVGGQVKFRGVTLGQVTGIGLVSAMYPEAISSESSLNQRSYQLVVVRFTVDPKKIGPSRDPRLAAEQGLRARLASQGLTGLAYIELDFVDPTKFPVETVPWTPRQDVIPSMPSTIAQVQDAAQLLMGRLQNVDVEKLTTGVQLVLDDLHRQLTGGDTHATLVEAQSLLRVLRVSVEQANLPALAADLRASSTAVRNLVDGKQTREMIGSATLAADRMAAAANRLPALIQGLEAAVRRADDGVGDLRQDLAPLLRDARATAANLRETSEQLRRNPSGVLLGAPPPREVGR